MDFVVTITIAVLLREAYAWLPNFSKWLLDQAIRHLPAEERERFSEEWHATLNALPNTMYGFVHVLSIFLAVGRINSEFADNKISELVAEAERWRKIQNQYNDILVLHQECVEKFRGLKLKHGGNALVRDLDHTSDSVLSIDSLCAKLDQAEGLYKSVSVKRDQLTQLFDNLSPSSDKMELLIEVDNTLSELTRVYDTTK